MLPRNEVVNVDTGLTDESIGGIIGALLTVLLILLAIAIFIALRRRRRRPKYPPGNGLVDGVGGAAVKCSAGLGSRGGACGGDGRGYGHTMGGVSNGNVAVVNGHVYDVTSASDVESDSNTCCGGVASGRRLNGRGPAIEFYHVPSGRLPELPKTPDSSGNLCRDCFVVDIIDTYPAFIKIYLLSGC